jgi:hypothetical protein
MTALRAWWLARQAARRELDDLYAAIDAELGTFLDAADRGAR